MGVYIEMFVAAADGRRLSFDQFKLLLTSLVEERIVKLPFAIIEGDFTRKDKHGYTHCDSPISMILTKPRTTDSEDTKWQRCTGNSLEELHVALLDLPFGKRDIAVHFTALDRDNEELREGLTKHCSYNADVVIFALRRPVEVFLFNMYAEGGDVRSHTLMHYFTTSGKSGPHCIDDTLLRTILSDFFGPALLVDCCWS